MRRSAPLRRVTPLRAKPKPRKPAAEARHIAQVAAMPCLVCGRTSTVHHVTAPVTGGRLRRSDQRVVPLCRQHHQIQDGPRESVEALGHGGFFHTYGIDLLATADRLWAEGQGA